MVCLINICPFYITNIFTCVFFLNIIVLAFIALVSKFQFITHCISQCSPEKQKQRYKSIYTDIEMYVTIYRLYVSMQMYQQDINNLITYINLTMYKSVDVHHTYTRVYIYTIDTCRPQNTIDTHLCVHIHLFIDHISLCEECLR